MSKSSNEAENLYEWGLEKFLTREELANYSWEERMEYEDKLNRYRDWHNVMDYARQEGRRKVRVSAAKVLKANGSTIHFIQKITNLSKQEIKNL